MSTTSQSNPSDGPIDEQAVRRAKQEIQGLVQEVVELSKSEVEPSDFYASLLEKCISALAAVGGVVWTIDENTGLKLEHQINLHQTGLAESEEAQMQHGRLLQQIAQKGEPALIPGHSGAGTGEGDDPEGLSAANPTEFLLVVAPIKSDQGVDGLVEVFQRTGARPTTQRGYLRFLVQICELAGEYVKTRRLRHFATKQTLWEQLESFTSQVHHRLNSHETAYTIANEGRRLIGCDRVTVVLRKGAKYQVVAISGQDTFDKRSNVVRLLRNLSTTVAKTGEDLWFTGDTSDLAPQVEKSVNAYVDESHSKQVAVLPLHEDEAEVEDEKDAKKKKKRLSILGAIVIEQLVDSRAPDGLMQRVDVVRRHSSTALTNAQHHENLFLLPLWRFLGSTRVLVTARNLPKTILAAIVLTGLIIVACFVPYDFTVVADGKLLPQLRRNIFSNLDGMVMEVPVSHGQAVQTGQLLARQRSLALEDEITQLRGQLAETREEIISVEQQRRELDPATARTIDFVELTGRLAQLRTQLASRLQQKELLDTKEKMLTVTSPIDGRVITWKVRELLENRPVNRGQRLMEIADPSSPWELEIYLPEAKMGHIVKFLQEKRTENPDYQLTVTFILETHAGVYLEGQIKEVDTTAEIYGESGNTVRMVVTFSQAELKKLVDDPENQLKIGADVKAKIHCGERAVGFVIFHELFEQFQSRVRFRF